MALGVIGAVWWLVEQNVSVWPELAPRGGVDVVPARWPSESVPTATPVRSDERTRVAERDAQGQVVLAEAAEMARGLNAPGATGKDDLEILQALLDFFRKANQGANPVGGLNEEIADALRGKNALRLAVIPPELPLVNADGALLDRWGTPYFFHPQSRDILEIRSAGPDRKLWTADDMVAE